MEEFWRQCWRLCQWMMESGINDGRILTAMLKVMSVNDGIGNHWWKNSDGNAESIVSEWWNRESMMEEFWRQCWKLCQWMMESGINDGRILTAMLKVMSMNEGIGNRTHSHWKNDPRLPAVAARLSSPHHWTPLSVSGALLLITKCWAKNQIHCKFIQMHPYFTNLLLFTAAGAAVDSCSGDSILKIETSFTIFITRAKALLIQSRSILPAQLQIPLAFPQGEAACTQKPAELRRLNRTSGVRQQHCVTASQPRPGLESTCARFLRWSPCA